MSKQYPFLRAFCCTAIALALAAALGGLRHIAVSGLSTWQSHIGAILAFAAVVFLLASVGFLRERSTPQQFSETGPPLPLGLNVLTAAYTGDPNYGFSTSAPLNQSVLEGSTTTALTSSPNPSIYGQSVTFIAVVTSSLGAPPPDGETVTFMKGTTVLGTGTLSGGSASLSTSALPVGANNIAAVYGGDANLVGSKSKLMNQVVNKATTVTALASSQNPSSSGQPVTFTAIVTPQYSGTVNGYVTFYDGTTALRTEYLSGGVAKCTISTLTSGSHGVTATYGGNVDLNGSSASLTQTVN